MKNFKKLTATVVSLMMVCTSMGGFTLWSSAVDNETSSVILEKNDKLHFFTEKSADGKISNHYVITHKNNEIESYEYKTLIISTNGVNENGFVIYGGNHNIILKNAEFNNSIMLSKQDGQYATANIDIEGTNKVTAKTRGTVVDTTGKAGISVPEGTTLNLSGTGTLTATGSDDGGNIWGDGGAGIGGSDGQNAGTINISGNITVNAQGGFNGAGIGGGDNGNGGNITISGGKVNATGSGAGIGGGYDGDCGEVTITGGDIDATGGQYAAGIGGGYNGNGKDIKISGGTVTAKGGFYGAGIGGGHDGNGKDIKISGGTVTAKGGFYGAGIGGGYKGNSGNITISKAKVTATGGSGAAGIGGGNGFGGFDGECEKIEITNSSIIAKTVEDAEPIGGGYTEFNSGVITINGTKLDKATRETYKGWKNIKVNPDGTVEKYTEK